ncbi:MAG: hypothetical protein JWP91_3800 [Fibrobacteres bacterium]|nr:hypothetical protein [Fibrobacterota bacterium]
MAKHDQRILKFLTQNADRAPTITEMMTRLNISISDISDSLGSLQAQGLISKKTNNQGIECWFPNGPQASPQQVQPMQVHAPHLATQQMPTTQIPITMAGEGRNRDDAYAQVDSRYGSGPHERQMQIPDPQPPAPKQQPVQVSHIPMAEQAYSQRSETFRPEYPRQEAPRYEAPRQPEPVMSGAMPTAPMYGLSPQPSSKGIGFLTFALGLVIAVGVATWLSGRLAANEVKRASSTFVDKKALTDATTSFTDFQEKTKAHVTALEAEVKQLTAQLALSKSMAESLQTTTAKAAESDAGAKGKAESGKKAAATAAAAKAKAPLAKAKPAKAASSSSAIAKAAARGAAKKRKASSASHETSEYSSTSESSSYDSPSSSASPSVPEPPGLEELPPPPSE